MLKVPVEWRSEYTLLVGHCMYACYGDCNVVRVRLQVAVL